MKQHPSEYCALAHLGLFIGEKGNITPCCASGHVFGNIKDTSLADAFENKEAKAFRKNFKKGIYDRWCRKCIDRGLTNRVAETRKYPRSRYKWYKPEFVHLEINFSNICNLACVMCAPRYSHLYGKFLGDSSYDFFVDKQKMYEIANDALRCRTIFIKGGEPFVQPNINIFFEELLKNNNRLPNIRILSNGVFIKDSTFELLQQLNKRTRVDIAISAEATGKLYRYIRGNKYTFEEHVLPNMVKFFNNGLSVPVAISSVLSFWNMDVWLEQHLEMKRLLLEHDIMCVFNCQVVSDPPHSSVFLKQHNTRRKIHKQITDSEILSHALPVEFLEKKTVEIDLEKEVAKIDAWRKLNIQDINPYIFDNLEI